MNRRIRSSITALIVTGSIATYGQVSVLTANYNRNRTNANLNETILNLSSVNPLTFGKVTTYSVDGSVYAQPLYVNKLELPGLGPRNVVYVATMHNSVYAFDADATGAPDPIWKTNLGAAVPSVALNFHDINGEVGILSTPVIDLPNGVAYAVSNNYENNTPIFRLHALSLLDGHEMLNGPVVIAGTVPGNGAGAANDGTLSFDASQQLQRAGLALGNNHVYIGFGAHGDNGDWHGWMFAYETGNLTKRPALLNTTPNGEGGSIWQAGRAPAIDSNGNLYVVTGNGDYDGDTAFSESSLTLSGTDLSVLSSFTPDNWAEMNDHDWDLGSSGPLLVPGDNAVLTGAKSGDIFALQKTGPAPAAATPAVPAVLKGSLSTPAAIFDVALWNNQDGPLFYVFQSWGSVQAYRLKDGMLDGTFISQSMPSVLTLYAGMAVSAKGGQNGTGILWQTSGNYDIAGVPGSLHAYDALDLTNELWNSDIAPNRDALGAFTKFAAPTVANGRVFVATLSNAVVAYGVLGTGVERSGARPPHPDTPRF